MVDNRLFDEFNEIPEYRKVTLDEKSAVSFENRLRKLAGLKNRAAYSIYCGEPFFVFDNE